MQEMKSMWRANKGRSITLTMALIPALFSAAWSNAQPEPGLLPFTARFGVEWKGMSAGTTTIELQSVGPGRFTYSSGNQARGIFKLAFPDVIRQSSTLQLENNQIRPLSFSSDDGSSDQSKDVALSFDWTRNRVTGTAETKPVTLDLKPGVQDAMSVQLALILELQAGRSPSAFWMADKNEIKEYLYHLEGEATLKTALGTLPTVIWSSHRPNSDRITRVWYAPSLGFTPVQAARTRGNKTEWTMRIQKLTRGVPGR
jgi:hypothetical protein